MINKKRLGFVLLGVALSFTGCSQKMVSIEETSAWKEEHPNASIEGYYDAVMPKLRETCSAGYGKQCSNFYVNEPREKCQRNIFTGNVFCTYEGHSGYTSSIYWVSQRQWISEPVRYDYTMYANKSVSLSSVR
ncbi:MULTISPECIES: hypothetical protein [Sulfuricurvum]|uniref:hypothetical protein n=1 Tax=Sulfuricurvum TaxID=286130 RepID=UPI0025F4D66B|nr:MULTISPECIES: hypothetical protein [Sulfuricurvum]